MMANVLDAKMRGFHSKMRKTKSYIHLAHNA